MARNDNPLGKVMTQATTDVEFRKKLVADPESTLAAEGISVPAGTELKVVEDTSNVRHLVLPAMKGPLSEAELAEVAAAGGDECMTEDVCFWLIFT